MRRRQERYPSVISALSCDRIARPPNSDGALVLGSEDDFSYSRPTPLDCSRRGWAALCHCIVGPMHVMKMRWMGKEGR